jgi:hypothetical protein
MTKRFGVFCCLFVALLPFSACMLKRKPNAPSLHAKIAPYFEHPEQVKTLAIGFELYRHRRIPKSILRFSNLERLNLNTPLGSTSKTSRGCTFNYLPSKVRHLPPGFQRLTHLKRLDLIGCRDFDQRQEFEQLSEMDSLQTLSIELKSLHSELAEGLSLLKQLDTLILYPYAWASDEQIALRESLRKALPHCIIE